MSDVFLPVSPRHPAAGFHYQFTNPHMLCHQAHQRLAKKHKYVRSYGTGKRCKLPGHTADNPVLFDFGTPYAEMLEELSQRDARLYTQNGCLAMVERNMEVKRAPQRWADHDGHLDIVLTFERVVFNAVLEELNRRADENDGAGEPCQVINIETIDRKKEAVTGAAYAEELVDLLGECEDLEEEAATVIADFENGKKIELQHQVAFY